MLQVGLRVLDITCEKGPAQQQAAEPEESAFVEALEVSSSLFGRAASKAMQPCGHPRLLMLHGLSTLHAGVTAGQLKCQRLAPLPLAWPVLFLLGGVEPAGCCFGHRHRQAYTPASTEVGNDIIARSLQVLDEGLRAQLQAMGSGAVPDPEVLAFVSLVQVRHWLLCSAPNHWGFKSAICG